MNQKEVVETLLVKAKIEPGFTELGMLPVFLSMLLLFNLSKEVLFFGQNLSKEVSKGFYGRIPQRCPSGY